LIPIVYALIDEESDPADVAIDYSLGAGNSWRPCTEYPAPLSEGRYGIASAPLAQSGIAHTFVWDSTADLVTFHAAVSLSVPPSGGQRTPLTVSPLTPIGPPPLMTPTVPFVDIATTTACLPTTSPACGSGPWCLTYCLAYGSAGDPETKPMAPFAGDVDGD